MQDLAYRPSESREDGLRAHPPRRRRRGLNVVVTGRDLHVVVAVGIPACVTGNDRYATNRRGRGAATESVHALGVIPAGAIAPRPFGIEAGGDEFPMNRRYSPQCLEPKLLGSLATAFCIAPVLHTADCLM